MRPLTFIVALAGGTALLSLGSCTESDCHETRTCGGGTAATGGSGADGGGSGGMGATGGGASCTSDGDCDDDKPCNGAERCVAGTCVAGTPFTCANPNPAHCSATCAESGTATQCVIEALDTDGDQYGDAMCVEATTGTPNDCDDQDSSAHPNAAEICDGIDNDCDGAGDFVEGFTLSGTPGDLIVSSDNAEAADMAWSSVAQAYGIVWQDERDGDPEVYFTLMDQNGAAQSSEVRVSVVPDDSTAPKIAWGGDAFGVVFQDNGYGNQEIGFRRVDAAGTPLGTVTRVSNAGGDSSQPSVAWLGADWLVAWIDYRSVAAGQLYGRVLDASGVPKSAELVLDPTSKTPLLPALVAATGSVAAVWLEDGDGAGGGADTVRWGAIDGTPKLVKSAWLSAHPAPAGESAGFPAIAASASGQLAMWSYTDASATKLNVARLQPDGTVSCADETTLFQSGTPIPLIAGSAALGQAAVLAFVEDKDVSLGWSDTSDCSFGFSLTVDSTVDLRSLPIIRSGDSGFAVVWSDRTVATQPTRIRRRVFGPHLCD